MGNKSSNFEHCEICGQKIKSEMEREGKMCWVCVRLGNSARSETKKEIDALNNAGGNQND